MPRFTGHPVSRHAVVAAVAVAIVSLVAGCSGSGSSTSTRPEQNVAASTAVPAPTTTVVPTTTQPAVEVEPASVRIDVAVAGTSSELAGTLAESTDPFGDFVSCSGLRAAYGTYSVLASAGSGAVRSVSVVSSDLVAGPGAHDAAVRIEYTAAPAVDALGTITVGPDVRSGSFVAFDAGGGQVEGTFECTGGGNDPQPLVVGADDGVLEAVEVFALLRSGDEQRLLGLATPADGAALVECPGAAGAPADSLSGVRVEGDESIGAITSFELTDGAMPTMQLRAGGVVYTSDLVMRGGSDPATAGSFSADANGVTVDGAFRCS